MTSAGHGDQQGLEQPSNSSFTVRMPSGTQDPLSDSEIRTYREEIDRMDRLIIDAIHRRSEVSKAIGRTRQGSGGTKLVYTREVAIINMFREEFGSEGVEIAKALLQLGRGRLG
ncbi:chorismate mutase [Corynebacterium heidelbergense]|uniref:Chorismate mutase n=1 Tax=Corynebacterium heidelbergense TaxID=2055947 RepID=A0A364V670_9CORY|nr:chorismate mutase [Corynebacterium heidelbergense]RAV32137.1 chorismate mutase [Corynebacterium heidelbergense]RAV33977.1 chorismate mutase [Corynebacterium heidelbergense]